MSVVAISKITSKGQVTIPEPIRKRLGVEAGDRVEWRENDHGVVAVRRVSRRLEDLIGFLGRPGRSVSAEEMKAAIRERMKRKHARR